MLSGQGIRPNPENVEKIQNWKQPTHVKEVQSFLGLANYYRRFVNQYSQHVRPMIDLIKKGAKFVWSDACEKGFNHVKTVLLSPEVMAHPQTEGLLILDTDASDTCTGAVLSQIEEGKEKSLLMVVKV